MKKNSSELTVEATDALLRQKLERLSRRCPTPLLGMAARDELLDLRPQLEEALEALAEIEGRRGLTAQELARRRAFHNLLSTAAGLTAET